ncbi:MAG: hypothetical protein IT537_01125 [Hyphomicrobiales bacterium]|nr:hypothetical protein [Hyphomicrobiales bacterium]
MSIRFVTIALLAVTALQAQAGPSIVPPGDQPGRERERFTPSPLDRYMQPAAPAEPLIRFECHDPATSKLKRRRRRGC